MVIERVNGRIPILLGVGGNNTRAIVDTLQNDDFTGVDAILSVVPYYNKPSQEGIYQHYKAIAEATELPIVLYNVCLLYTSTEDGSHGEKGYVTQHSILNKVQFEQIYT